MSIDELLPEARELKRETGGLPSKSTIQRALKIRWDRAVEVHQQLSVEDAERATARRTAMRRLGARKNPRWVPPAPSRSLPASASTVVAEPVAKPMIVPAEVIAEEVPAAEAESFPKSSRRVATWPALVVAAPAAVAIWAGSRTGNI